ncbi:response regulator [Corynebacterium callunae]|uniref:response regulator n=1 Tax=Corynebacterium callunae TaxID=1721 RepID=UPI0039822BDE
MKDKTLQVLVVDDDFRVAGIHASIVDQAPGFSVLATARTVAEATLHIATSQPDLLLVDVYLPDGDGIDLVRTHAIDAFVLSAADDAPTVRRAFQAGALGYLLKPFPQKQLVDRLDSYARFQHVLSGSAGLSQEKIDQGLAILHGSTTPVNSRSATEQLLLDALQGQEISAAEAAEIAGVSRATAQRRLASMASQGVVEVRLKYGQSGRPEHLYSRPQL